jgi:hypothetical protein
LRVSELNSTSRVLDRSFILRPNATDRVFGERSKLDPDLIQVDLKLMLQVLRKLRAVDDAGLFHDAPEALPREVCSLAKLIGAQSRREQSRPAGLQHPIGVHLTEEALVFVAKRLRSSFQARIHDAPREVLQLSIEQARVSGDVQLSLIIRHADSFGRASPFNFCDELRPGTILPAVLSA